MISKPILIVRIPMSVSLKSMLEFKVDMQVDTNDEYHVIVLYALSLEQKEILFEVHGAPNIPRKETPTYDSGSSKVNIRETLRKWSQAKRAQDELNKQRSEEAEDSTSRVRDYKRKEGVVKAILWDGSDEAYNELCAFAAVPVIKKDGWLWVKVDPDYGPSLHIGHYLIRDEEGELHAVESIHFLSQFELK